ncbi:family 16 glycoside hydrolase [Silvibacterium acidisoli]|uniref:family 16 glycoside hydrolase n=1 Tax=Acidobacteriaceae bacterium ZG23-2 TaxID=2883246 RepID=UPI00406C6200
MRKGTYRLVAIATASALSLIATCWIFFAIHSPSLPYAPDFHRELRGWKTYGGSWQQRNGMVINASDERGAKVVAGNSKWGDYQIDTDMRLMGRVGDAGVILRVSNPEIGVDAYRGYYVGLNLRTASLLAGITDYEWLMRAPVPVPGGVRQNTWYHLHVVVVGCRLAAEATNMDNGSRTVTALDGANCIHTGQVGLRSLDTGTEWRNFSVRPATGSDLSPLLARTDTPQTAQYPAREDQFAKMHAFMDRERAQEAPISGVPAVDTAPLREPQSIHSLASILASSPVVTVRGAVTSLDPLYVQDGTGGVAVELNQPEGLNLGDEVELTGITMRAGSRIRLHAQTARILWDRSLPLPAPISSTQAASGAFDGSLIEVTGEIDSISPPEEGQITLTASDISQRFRVVLPQGLDGTPSLSPGAVIRVIGVCANSDGTDAVTSAFTLYARGSEDLLLVSPPPWTRGRRLVYIIAGFICFMAILGWLYLQAERWRLRAVLEERERLALDMHDTLAQSFAGLGFHLHSLRRGFEQQGHVPPRMMQKLDEACDMATQSHREASARILALHPLTVDKGDILTLIQRSALTMLHGAHLPIRLVRSGQPRELSLAVQDSLLRIAREAIANVLRHSAATEMMLSLEYKAKTVVVKIIDNGVGMQLSNGNIGLESMRTRAAEVDGEVHIASTQGSGTTVSIQLPYGKRTSLRVWFRLQYASLLLTRKG